MSKNENPKIVLKKPFFCIFDDISHNYFLRVVNFVSIFFKDKLQKIKYLDILENMEVLEIPKNPQFFCEYCKYITSNKKDYAKHLSTAKHQNGSILEVKNPQKSPKFECECGRQFVTHSGMWKHKQKCGDHNGTNNIIDILVNENKTLKELMIEQNQDFKTLIMELVKKDNNSINTNISNVNSNNQTFNLQFFLNEQCKDALNIGEFVDSIKVQLSEVENTGRLGYVEGVSKILIKNLIELDAFKRPIHCSDLKREVLYIKDNDKWSKEDGNKQMIKKVIKDVTNKNIRKITEWTNLNPDCTKSDSKKNDQYLKIVMNSMSGSSNEEQNNNIEKIVKNITKSVIIDK